MEVTTTTKPASLQHAAHALCEELKRASGMIDKSQPAVVRAMSTVDKFDPSEWLAAVAINPKLFWSGRDDNIATAGAGAAHTIKAPGLVNITAIVDDIHTRLATDTTRLARYFGGFRFDMGLEKPADQWRDFGAAQFVLPRVVVTSDGDQTTIAAHLVFPEDCFHVDHALEEIEGLLRHHTGGRLDLPKKWTRTDSPSESGWENLLAGAMTVFGETDFRKIVLARKATLRSDGVDFMAMAVLNRLRAATADCYHACFEFGDASFISSSPERLYRRQGRALETEAIAGTRPRGQSAEVDQHFSRELLLSDKDLREHDYVAMGVEESLTPLSDSLTISDRNVLQLPRMQHLCRRFKATLKDGVGDSQLLERLHPTAAVGTYPTHDAAKLLAVFESIDRGWYAGPLGWIGADAAEFAVAIRSGLARKDQLMLYAGAGVLEGSTASAEWNEIEIKLGNFIKALK